MKVEPRGLAAVGRYRIASRISAFLLLAIFLVVLAAWACGDDDDVEEADYIAANEAVLHALPMFPGAERTQTTSAPYFEGDGANVPIAGYTTKVVFRAPDGTSAEDVVSFFEQELSGDWDSQREESPIVDQPSGQQIATVITATFTQDGATVSVNTDGIATGDSSLRSALTRAANSVASELFQLSGGGTGRCRPPDSPLLPSLRLPF
jgi:hypothetical protein